MLLLLLFFYSCVLEMNLKKSIHVLLRDVPLQCRVGVLAHHVIYGPHNLSHFLKKREESHCGDTLTINDAQNTVYAVTAQSHLSVYVAVSVNVIKVKRPLQLFSQCSSQQYRQTHYKVLVTIRQKTNSDTESKTAHGSAEMKCFKGRICNLRAPVSTSVQVSTGRNGDTQDDVIDWSWW